MSAAATSPSTGAAPRAARAWPWRGVLLPIAILVVWQALGVLGGNVRTPQIGRAHV